MTSRPGSPLFASIFLAVALFAGSAQAQESTKVRFPAGASSTTISGAVTGRDYVDYILGARSGQTMQAALTPASTHGNGTIYFNILPPGSNDEAVFVGSMDDDGRHAEVTLPADGDYKIRIYLMGNDRDANKTVGYSLQVSIR
ncbi:hypothetical protein ACQKGL_13895 [Ensifer adhaerens]|uniref:hypothetical protein n=1 Tax=Ensifer adhaerens TaxID=106592 RepID=UPI003D00D154